MRFLCFNFLMATIGPTVRRICAAEAALTDDDLFRVTHECWDSIYSESFASCCAVEADLSPSAYVSHVRRSMKRREARY